MPNSDMSKDNEFYRWNKTNIMANLLQAEDHLCTVIDDLAPEHAACVIKHLTTTIGEIMEISKHCEIADRNKCSKYKALGQEVYKLKNKFEDEGINENSLAEVRKIRKEFEKIVGNDTDKCETGFCKFDPYKKEREGMKRYVSFKERVKWRKEHKNDGLDNDTIVITED